MKKILLAAAALSACGAPETSDRRSLPDDRAPTLGDVRGSRVGLTLAYDPASVPTPFWAAWRGEATLAFGEPDAGLDHLPATLELVSGADELDDGCMSGEMDGSWSLGADGAIAVRTFADEEGAATISLDGILSVVSFYVPPTGPGDGSPTVATRLEGAGTWTVTPGAACGPDDFAGGLTGRWTAFQSKEDRASIETPVGPAVGPRARLILVDPNTGTVHAEISGPLGRVAQLAGVSR